MYSMSDKTYHPDDLLGTAEVAEVLSVSKQRIHALRKMAEFPDPIKTLASTPIWARQDVTEFLAKWKPWLVMNNG